MPSLLARTLHAWGLTRVTGIEKLAGQRGSYLFLLRVPDVSIKVGSAGTVCFSAGLYGYVGSANGRSVTLAHRLARHWRRKKAHRWHIDYVTCHAEVTPVAAYVSMGSVLPEERLARLCAERFPVIAGFGNSDLRGKTPGHLFLLQPERLRQRPEFKASGEESRVTVCSGELSCRTTRYLTIPLTCRGRPPG